MNISEQDAADMLSEVLLDNNRRLNDQFIEMVENIHMKTEKDGSDLCVEEQRGKRQAHRVLIQEYPKRASRRCVLLWQRDCS
jgi:hypothetical protein